MGPGVSKAQTAVPVGEKGVSVTGKKCWWVKTSVGGVKTGPGGSKVGVGGLRSAAGGINASE